MQRPIQLTAGRRLACGSAAAVVRTHALQAFISLDFGYLDPRGPPESFHVFSELLARTAEVAEQPHKNM